MGEAPSLRAGGVPDLHAHHFSMCGLVNLRALQGSQGRHHITRGNKIPGRLGPGFASLLNKFVVSGTPGHCTQ